MLGFMPVSPVLVSAATAAGTLGANALAEPCWGLAAVSWFDRSPAHLVGARAVELLSCITGQPGCLRQMLQQVEGWGPFG